MWRGERLSGREILGGVVVPVGAAPIARNEKSAWRADGKFSALQSVEDPQNAERISILREPFPQRPESLRRRGRRGARWATLTIPALWARRQDGVAGKWRRNGLKRLNPGRNWYGLGGLEPTTSGTRARG